MGKPEGSGKADKLAEALKKVRAREMYRPRYSDDVD